MSRKVEGAGKALSGDGNYRGVLLKGIGTLGGEDNSPAKADFFFETHQAVPDFHFGLSDFADPVNDFAERFCEPPGVERSACLVEFLTVLRRNDVRSGPLGRGIGDLGEKKGVAAPQTILKISKGGKGKRSLPKSPCPGSNDMA